MLRAACCVLRAPCSVLRAAWKYELALNLAIIVKQIINKNFDFCDTIRVIKIRLFDKFCKKKVYFHGFPGICTVNAEEFVGVLILTYFN